MGIDLINKEVIRGAFNTDDTFILTPNMRLKRKIHIAYGLLQKEKGAKAWKTPSVHAFKDYLTSIWNDLSDHASNHTVNKVIISPSQLRAVWTNVIMSNSEIDFISSPATLVNSAIEATRLLELWELDINEISSDTIENDQFKSWYQLYQDEMSHKGLITFEQSVGVLTEGIIESIVKLPKAIYLYAFDEIPPLYKSFFDSLKSTGSKFTELDNINFCNSAKKISVHDRRDQFIAAAAWSKTIVEQSPGRTIGIICPELIQNRGAILEAFNTVFEPQHILPDVNRYTAPYNISAGVPLSQAPLIRDGLAILAIGRNRAPVTKVLAIIKSSYLGGAESECTQRASFDIHLRDTQSASMSLGFISDLETCPPTLKSILSSYLEQIQEDHIKLRPSQWACHFNDCLQSIGWPGQRELDSEEYQAVSHWKDQLDALAKLDTVNHQCTRKHAFNLLSTLINDCTFQVKTKDSPIQILGMLEASGLHFDHLWVIDMNDDIWPQAPSPNPFISHTIQKEHGMPHASAARELEFSKRIVDRLIHGAHDVVFSFALWDEDRELRASPLIDSVPLEETPESYEFTDEDYAHTLVHTVPLIEEFDSIGPIPSSAVPNIKGGTRILEDQANCPFSAMSMHRLRSTEIKSPVLGISQLEHGNLVHKVMDYLWSELKDQSSLLNCTKDDIDALLNKGLDIGISKLLKKRENIGPRLIELEKTRVKRVITEWLEIEKDRAPFKVIATELPVQTEICGLPIKIIIDRVDEISKSDDIESQRLHIDYKVGEQQLSKLGGETIRSPQLPIYSTTDKNGSDGVAYAQLKTGSIAVKGIGRSDHVINGLTSANKHRVDLPNEWDQIVDHWKSKLNNTANDFLTGITDVTPYSQSSCMFCHLSSLCRKES